MQVEIIAQHRGGDHRVMRVLVPEGSELIIGRLFNDHMFFDPPYLALGGLGLEEAASMFDYFKRFSVAYQSDSIRYSGHPISQISLLGNDVDHFGLEMLAQTGAPAQRGHQSDAYCEAKARARAGSAKEPQCSKHSGGESPCQH
jgi:hypothetical protein